VAGNLPGGDRGSERSSKNVKSAREMGQRRGSMLDNEGNHQQDTVRFRNAEDSFFRGKQIPWSPGGEYRTERIPIIRFFLFGATGKGCYV